MESSNARIAAASEDATFLHGAVQIYRELAKRNRHRDRATQRRAQRKLSGAGDGSGQHLRASDSKTSLHSNKVRLLQCRASTSAGLNAPLPLTLLVPAHLAHTPHSLASTARTRTCRQ